MMAITYHKAVSDDGGLIGDQIGSGEVNALLPEITLAEQSTGVTVSRKFYIVNDDVVDVLISNFSKDADSVFTAILFESTGDAQVVGDLTGSEVDESPISVTIPASGHKSFWLQIDVPIGSTKTDNYGTVDVKQIF